MIRRRALLLAAMASGCASAPAAAGVRPLAPGVWMFPGQPGAADLHNQGRIGNAGFIAGPRGVIAIDTGTSAVHGRALLGAIEATTGQRPRVALVTHTRPEFLFGGGAFRAAGVPVRMHQRTARLMASRCENCLKQLRQVLGDAAMAGTALYQPDQEFVDAEHDLGELIGRPLKVRWYGHSSGPGDVAVEVPDAGVLFAGGLVDVRRIPDIQDSDLEGWKRALKSLRALGARTVVPGHGDSAAAPAAIDGVERYLAQLERRVRAMVEAGDSLLGVGDAAELPEFSGWDQYDVIHRRNASIAFVRFEREMLFKQ